MQQKGGWKDPKTTGGGGAASQCPLDASESSATQISGSSVCAGLVASSKAPFQLVAREPKQRIDPAASPTIRSSPPHWPIEAGAMYSPPAATANEAGVDPLDRIGSQSPPSMRPKNDSDVISDPLGISSQRESAAFSSIVDESVTATATATLVAPAITAMGLAISHHEREERGGRFQARAGEPSQPPVPPKPHSVDSVRSFTMHEISELHDRNEKPIKPLRLAIGFYNDSAPPSFIACDNTKPARSKPHSSISCRVVSCNKSR